MTTNLYLLHLARASAPKRLLSYFFSNPGASHYLREIALLIRTDPANLSREMKRLEREGIFVSQKRGNQKYFSLNKHYPLYAELKSMADKTAIKPETAPVCERKPTTTLYIVAGPNGAGKTTFAKKFLPSYVCCRQFINADLIAGGLSPFSPDAAALQAGRLLLQKIEDLSGKGTDFGFETTLSGKSYLNTLRRMRACGYTIHLFFLWIPTIELSLARIAERVRRGGHDIPEPVVRRRFSRGIRHLFRLYRPLLDSWTLFDNSQLQPHLIAAGTAGDSHVNDPVLFEKISKIAEAE